MIPSFGDGKEAATFFAIRAAYGWHLLAQDGVEGGTAAPEFDFQLLGCEDIKREAVALLLCHEPLSLVFEGYGFLRVIFTHQFFVEFFGYDYVLDAVGEHFFGVLCPGIGGFFGVGALEFS